MGGILDSRTRIFDTILTDEGKKQLANGNLKFEFYSFTDLGMVYSEDTIVSGGLDATYRIGLEATNLPQDQITFEANDGGRLHAFPVSGSESYTILQGQIFSGSQNRTQIHITGSQFNSLATILLSQSVDAFRNQQILKSPDPTDNKERQFLIGPENAQFKITKKKPFSKKDIKIAKIENIESLFYDKRLSHIPNFQFLPPLNKARPGEEIGTFLGEYANINEEGYEDYEELEKELKPLLTKGFNQRINFIETSNENNIICQFFEISEGIMRKLDVIDFGSFPSPNGLGTKHVFFVGKVFIDNLDSPTFVNMFVLIFEE